MFKPAMFAATIVIANQSFAEGGGLEEVTIIGVSADAQQLPGSAFVVDEQQLAKFEYTDINRMMRQVPGVYLQEEDGFGLRPNIGIRGAGAERSEKITLLEDGVLIAPAPYSAPAAYYFPTAGRMSGVEVLKGATILRHGPATVAGVVNLISTRIPEKASGQLILEAGNFGSNRVNASYGNSGENGGWLVETHQQESDGFKDIDRSNSGTGFGIEDYMLKGRLNSDRQAATYQQLDVKVQYSEEASDVTYVGLTDADFNADENRRYGLTALDQMDTRHSSATLRYLVQLQPMLSLTTTAYYNKFKRDWFKVEQIDGSGFGSVINGANNGDQSAQGILDGNIDANVSIKHNNREYLSKGVQLVADWTFANHQLQGGVRYHEDDVDRFQPTEVYRQIGSELIFDAISDPSSSNNRVEKAEALAVHVMDVWGVNEEMELTLGLRYENIKTGQRRYSDVARSTSNVTAENNVDELLWSVGITYELSDQWQLLAGAHAGFAPASPGSQQNVDPEKSANYEVGTRFQGNNLNITAIAFYSDYENKVTNCSVAFPCGDLTIGSESEGESETKGLEFTLSGRLYTNSKLSIPLTVSYTYTDANITDAAESGNQSGDVLPYVPENVLNAQLGFELVSGWSTYLSASYIDEMCIDSSCGRSAVDNTLLKTDDVLIFDLATHFLLTEATSVYLKVDNLFDEQGVVARSPGGARPGKPRTAAIGVKFKF
ncbi:TonB-dependent receptor [Dasania sp. GY-19]|uniref:TonB-dependent receptor n=1 Tax=Dasania phycosphaerae TaxID=2950436 RepID=A0A9J6RR20_9GAMM|nr:TonB-dependent receptor [Dasania phycosphaerae]MCZ0866810.1 TonB-dependent receptor [Dasania phycosphaerae]